MTPRRITNSTPPAWIGNEYSSMTPFNCDNSRLLLIAVDHFMLYDGEGNFLQDTPIAASSEPRWSRTDPGKFYYHVRNALYDNLGNTVKTFSEYTSITGKGESDISVDGHLVLCGTRPDGVEEVFVYDLIANSKGTVFPQSAAFDGLKITVDNEIILSRGDGIWNLHRNLKIAPTDGHACPVVINGKSVLLWCSSADPVTNKNAVIAIDTHSGMFLSVLYNLDWKYAFHISAAKDFYIISTDCPDKSLPSQVLKAYYDTTKPVEVLCDTGSIFNGYNSQVKAALSIDGSKVVGCSNFGDVTDANFCDVFMLDLAASTTPPVPPTETRIDYSPYVGKYEFVMKPRPDGAVDIYERKL